jgi:hypothetical protein
MAVVVVPALILGTGALIASLLAGSGGSSVRPARLPPGYRAISDGYFGYAVPSAWTQNNAYSDDVGDLDNQGTSGWAAEHIGARTTPPLAGASLPASFAAFGEVRPLPYHLSAGRPVSVKGATVAYQYTLTRPQGFQALAVDAWQAGTGAEIWLLVHADSATMATVIASLNG